MRQAGRWDPEFLKLRGGREFYEFSAAPQLAAEASLLPKRFGVDGIILFYDITTLAIAMGLEFTLQPDRGPVPAQPVRSQAALDRLTSQPAADRFGHIIELLHIVQRALNGSLPVLVFASAPFTLASYCIGTGKNVPATVRFVEQEPGIWQSLCEKITEATIGFLDTLCREGADAYQLFDSWAGELSPPQYELWSQLYHRQIFETCRAVPSILFVRECPHLDLMTQAGANVVSLGNRHNLFAAKAEFPDVCFQGNVDHQLLASGTAEQVRAATESCLKEGGGRRHVLNLNHGVDRTTPVQNFVEFVNTAVRQWPRASGSRFPAASNGSS
jgi:uroporphyrinogen decarboxylase